ncbi:MAG: hypothetical protein GXO97_07455 [Nitrospirae bacterium]|nr:hypothetical protein [Nitrospirota bacterium]
MSLFLFNCSATEGVFHLFKSTDRFRPLEADPEILYEEGARDFALKVARVLPEAIKTVEQRQYNHFLRPIKIYVCNSRESFRDITGRDVRALTYRGAIYISQRLHERPEWLKGYLTHELSHLLIGQHAGVFAGAKMPPWFVEGLATYVSNGGGAEDVTDTEAIQAILSGRHFVPELEGGFIFRKTASSFGLRPHMFYRQAALFVSFMKAYDEMAFKSLLWHIYRGSNFRDAFTASYSVPIKTLWNEFVVKLNQTQIQR